MNNTIKYKDYIGRLKHYELREQDSIFIIMDVKGVEMRFTCNEYEIKFPNVMGNSKFMYEIRRELEKDD